MQLTAPTEQGITASIPYLRSDLDRLRVDFTARNLADDLFDRRYETVRDGRTSKDAPSLEREGFELVKHRCPAVEEHLDELMAAYLAGTEAPAKQAYMDQTIPVIEKLSDAREVISADSSTIRYSAVLQTKNAMTPAMWPHFDFDAQDTERQLHEIFCSYGLDPKPFSRFILYQGWRALSPPPQDFPLAMCDGRTVTTSDVIPIEYHREIDGRDVINWSCGARYSPRHEWWFYPDMTPDEMLVFKGYDSQLGDSMKTLHVAIQDPTQDDVVPRISIETRYFALFD